MNHKVVIELKKLQEHYTHADKLYNLGTGLFDPPRFSKRTYTIGKKVPYKKNMKPIKKSQKKISLKPQIRIGKNYQKFLKNQIILL